MTVYKISKKSLIVFDEFFGGMDPILVLIRTTIQIQGSDRERDPIIFKGLFFIVIHTDSQE